MILKDIQFVSLSDFIVGVNSNGKTIEEFPNNNTEKMEQYKNAIVSSIHVLDENHFAVNIEV